MRTKLPTGFERVRQQRIQEIYDTFIQGSASILRDSNLPYIVYRSSDQWIGAVFTYIDRYETLFTRLYFRNEPLDQVFTRVPDGYLEAYNALIKFSNAIDIPTVLIGIHPVVFNADMKLGIITLGRVRYTQFAGHEGVVYNVDRVRVSEHLYYRAIPRIKQLLQFYTKYLEELKLRDIELLRELYKK